MENSENLSIIGDQTVARDSVGSSATGSGNLLLKSRRDKVEGDGNVVSDIDSIALSLLRRK